MAAPSAIESATLGVPASNFSGSGAQVARSSKTSRIMPPPPRKGGIASSSSRRPQSTPMPVGASILWPEKARKSTPRALHVGWHVRHALRAVGDHDRPDLVRQRRQSPARSEIVPSTLEACAIATTRVRGVSSWRKSSRSTVPSGVSWISRMRGASFLRDALPGHQVRVVLERRWPGSRRLASDWPAPSTPPPG